MEKFGTDVKKAGNLRISGPTSTVTAQTPRFILGHQIPNLITVARYQPSFLSNIVRSSSSFSLAPSTSPTMATISRVRRDDSDSPKIVGITTPITYVDYLLTLQTGLPHLAHDIRLLHRSLVQPYHKKPQM